jgi:transposase
VEKRTRRKFTASFKAKVALEALKEGMSIEELARKYELHPTQINSWKKSFLEHAASVFEGSETRSEDDKYREEEMQKLYAQIGQQKVEIDVLKKSCYEVT